MPECACGQPATEQVHVGTVNRGGLFVRAYAWMCDWCAHDEATMRDEARAS